MEAIAVEQREAAVMQESALEHTARIAALPGAVVRDAGGRFEQLELVVQCGDGLTALREALAERWGAPLKPFERSPSREARRHAVGRAFAPLRATDEIYASDDEYVVILMWRSAPKATVALGRIGASAGEIARLRRIARETVGPVERELPVVAPGDAVLVPEHEWVVSAGYAGPDRRARPTSLFSRYSLFGRRRRLPRGPMAAGGRFVDRLTGFARACAALYVLFGAVDACLTFHFVGKDVDELNPLLREALGSGPLIFFVSKQALAFAAFFLIARFQLFRSGRWLLAALIATYLALDLYWCCILPHGF